MAIIKPPLNFFKRVSNVATTTDTTIYRVELPDVAGIIISAYATNLTDTTQTINVKLSTDNIGGSMYTIVSALPILPNDAVNVAINKLVLGYIQNDPGDPSGGDCFIISSSNNNAVNMTISVLESVNSP
jgi:hypothetical protein